MRVRDLESREIAVKRQITDASKSNTTELEMGTGRKWDEYFKGDWKSRTSNYKIIQELDDDLLALRRERSVVELGIVNNSTTRWSITTSCSIIIASEYH